MMSGWINRLPAAAIAAFGLGLVACPLTFLLGGALGQFSPMFSMVTLPPFVAAGAFLLWRHLAAGARAQPHHPLMLAVLEVLSWIVVVVFIGLLSGTNLLTPFERAGAVCVSLLITAVLFLPIVLWRTTPLERRLARLPAAANAGIALLLWLAMGSVAIAYLRAPSAFIGRPRRQPQPVGWLDARPSDSVAMGSRAPVPLNRINTDRGSVYQYPRKRGMRRFAEIALNTSQSLPSI